MKKRRILSIASALAMLSSANAGTFIAADGAEYDTDKVQKIVFEEDVVTAYLTSGDVIDYDFSSLQRIYFSESNPTDLPDDLSSLNFYLYPNPVSETLCLKGVPKGTSFYVFAFDGTLKKEGKGTEDITEIDVASLPIGQYFLRIGDKAMKFIKK